jgi:heptosyltransferase I
VDRYERAATRFMNRSARSLPWTEKIEMPGVMDLIEVDDAIEKLDELMAAGAPRTPTG